MSRLWANRQKTPGVAVEQMNRHEIEIIHSMQIPPIEFLVFVGGPGPAPHNELKCGKKSNFKCVHDYFKDHLLEKF